MIVAHNSSYELSSFAPEKPQSSLEMDGPPQDNNDKHIEPTPPPRGGNALRFLTSYP
jgi:hypothetical protein